MSRRHSRDHRQHEYGQGCGIASALWDGPKTLSEITDHFRGYLRWVGFFSIAERLGCHEKRTQMMKRAEEALEELVERGWVVRQDERYGLTPVGREEASRLLADVRRTRTSLDRLVRPQTVSRVSLSVHLGLAALKLPAGLLSGSVGLLNDAADTLLDGLSSLLVYAGLRFDKERAVNIVLLLLMLGTGSITFYEAVWHLFVPSKLDVDWFTFLAAILSALVCLMLWAYQRCVGLRSGSIALIIQSVDSRNHVIVAASVTAGLVASLLQFPLLDTLVGLAVAVLILNSAGQLAVGLASSLGKEEINLSRYKMGLVDRHEQFRQAQLRDWMLYLVEKRGVQTSTELVARVCQALDFTDSPILRELGLAQQPRTGEMIEQNMAKLFECGWLAGDSSEGTSERLRVTDVGKEHLRQRMWRTRSEMHTPFVGRDANNQVSKP